MDYKEKQKEAKKKTRNVNVVLCQHCRKPVRYPLKDGKGFFNSPFVKASDKLFVHKDCLPQYEAKLSANSFTIKEVKEDK